MPRIIVADVLRLWEEIELDASVQLGLPHLTELEEIFAPLVEGTVEHGEEDRGIFA